MLGIIPDNPRRNYHFIIKINELKTQFERHHLFLKDMLGMLNESRIGTDNEDTKFWIIL